MPHLLVPYSPVFIYAQLCYRFVAILTVVSCSVTFLWFIFYEKFSLRCMIFALQVLLLLYICQWMVPLMWALSVDPDSAAIPYLTALGDLSGSFLLFVTFLSVSSLSKGNLL